MPIEIEEVPTPYIRVVDAVTLPELEAALEVVNLTNSPGRDLLLNGLKLMAFSLKSRGAANIDMVLEPDIFNNLKNTVNSFTVADVTTKGLPMERYTQVDMALKDLRGKLSGSTFALPAKNGNVQKVVMN